MSFNSPAKQERIERHLMRQRGAGARTVSTNFGFAFGSSFEPTSNDASPTRELEVPPAKRRKTVLTNEITVVEPVTTQSIEVAKSKKVVKQRRRFPVEDEAVNASASLPAGEDSFEAVLGSKSVASKKGKAGSKKVVENKHDISRKVDIEAAEPVAASKLPRRRAAATAASKVAAGFIEEAIPVDKKRRGAKPAAKTTRSRKANAVLESAIESRNEDEKEPDKTPTPVAKVIAKKRAATRKRKAVADDASVHGLDIAVVGDVDELADGTTLQRAFVVPEDHVSPKKSTSKTVSRPKTKKPPAKKRKQQNCVEADEQEEIRAQCVHNAAQLSPANQAELTPTTQVQEMPKQARRKREPLVETDMNVTMRSSSPEKTTRNIPNKATQRKRNPRQPLNILEHPPQSPTKPATKRRKLNIKLDAIETMIQVRGTEQVADSRAVHLPEIEDGKLTSIDEKESSMDWAATQKPRPADQRQGISTSSQRRGNFIHEDQIVAKKASRLPPSAETNNAKDQQSDERAGADKLHSSDITTKKSNAISHSSRTGETKSRKETEAAVARDEENVDWLFAPQLQANITKGLGAKSKTGGAGAKSRRFKMPDMDLDDLLSNIANFAEEKSQNVSLFAGGGEKARSRSEKKTAA